MKDIDALRIGISWILNIGVLLSLILVMIGGVIFLYQHGHNSLASFMLQPAQITNNLSNTFFSAFLLEPISLIELGLLVLVATQVLRMLLLVIFYLITNDVLFTIFSLFILVVMLVSLFVR